ncbi:helix-turn-helix domain-containing protein [Paenarthrobacter aurescens]|jgi:DNA-binding IclR family transcriptional regulator|uniref:helix-turn-helix domain-containing protein n=1 Tax=Paenarthrobacter aurescens TaxID=43663 RepID=UPI001EE2B400|nr:helix-turn-helix domain-containing protein [Paenarthrobacter aurescens]
MTKSAAVLRALAEHSPLRVSTVGQPPEATGEPMSSLYRLLSSLDEIGGVEQGTPRGKFRLGLASTSRAVLVLAPPPFRILMP